MRLSNSGRVLIIDDDFNEVSPLLKTLAKNCVPYYYFSGKKEELPSAHLDGIRFVFLDIELGGFGGRDDKSKASALVGVLKKIISPDNGPYIILFWTKHSEIIDHVLGYCKTAKISPIDHLDLDKIECKANSYIGLDTIIEEKIRDNGALLFLVEWENIVHKACSRFFHSFSSLIDVDKEWTQKVAGVLYEMAYADLGKERDKNADNELRLQVATKMLNQSFADVLQKITNEELEYPDGFTLGKQKLEANVKARINNWLFVDDSESASIRMGDIRLCTEDDSIAKSICDFTGLSNNKGKIIPVDVIVTAECDIALEKTLKTSEGKAIHRVLKGMIVPGDSKKCNKSAIERFGPFFYDGNVVFIYVHFGATILVMEDNLGEHAFNIRQTLMHDIQSKISMYINRVGNNMIQIG